MVVYAGYPSASSCCSRFGPPRLGGAQDLEGVLAREGVGEVAEIDEVDQLLGRHAGEQLPEGQAGALGLEIPQRIDHRADRHVHDALLRAEPAQLGVPDELAPKAPHVVESMASTSRPARCGVSARIAAVCTSLPRPIVNTKPCPSWPSSASVTTRT